jgi:hypothetical protein
VALARCPGRTRVAAGSQARSAGCWRPSASAAVSPAGSGTSSPSPQRRGRPWRSGGALLARSSDSLPRAGASSQRALGGVGSGAMLPVREVARVVYVPLSDDSDGGGSDSEADVALMRKYGMR